MLSLLKKLTGSTHEPPPPPDEFEKSISPELIKKIRDIQVKTNHLVNHMMSGEYVSAFKGRGMEFSEVREYEPGDDVRLIDWNVTARMGHPYIKEFREERELTVMLLVDVSSSGEFGSVEKLKNEVAAEIASVLRWPSRCSTRSARSLPTRANATPATASCAAPCPRGSSACRRACR